MLMHLALTDTPLRLRSRSFFPVLRCYHLSIAFTESCLQLLVRKMIGFVKPLESRGPFILHLTERLVWMSGLSAEITKPLTTQSALNFA